MIKLQNSRRAIQKKYFILIGSLRSTDHCIQKDNQNLKHRCLQVCQMTVCIACMLLYITIRSHTFTHANMLHINDVKHIHMLGHTDHQLLATYTQHKHKHNRHFSRVSNIKPQKDSRDDVTFWLNEFYLENKSKVIKVNGKYQRANYCQLFYFSLQ